SRHPWVDPHIRRTEAFNPFAFGVGKLLQLQLSQPIAPGWKLEHCTIALRLAEVETASGPTARNRVRASLSAFFNWAVREGLLDGNPVTGTARADERGSRDRVLTQAELAELWAALPQGDFGEILRLLILTGQRREEIGGLRWSEVDLDAGLIVLAIAGIVRERGGGYVACVEGLVFGSQGDGCHSQTPPHSPHPPHSPLLEIK